MIQRQRAFFLIGCAALHAGCGAVQFDVQRDVPEQRVQGDPTRHALNQLFGQSPFNPFTLDIDLASEARANGVTGVRRVTLRALSFTVTPTAAGGNDTDCWDFIEAVTVRVESTQAGTELPPVTIAEGMRPGCVQTFELRPRPDVDLRPYIEQGVRVLTSASGVPPADDVTFNGRVTFRVEAL